MGTPDFICIGAQKAATSWLAANLAHHPDIWLPFTKELHFFDPQVEGSIPHWRRRHANRLAALIERAKANGARKRVAYLEGLTGEDFILTEAWYRKVFAHRPAGRMTGEFTPRYATLPAASIDQMLSIAPDARFIYLIRDPVARAISNFRMDLAFKSPEPPSPEFIESFARRWTGARRYTSSDYADHIPRWDAKLDPERLLYLPFGEVKADPRRVLARVERFLGLAPFAAYPKAERRVNRTAEIALPDWLRPHLEADLARHRAFLEARFPPAFFARIA
ncbi:sulfotransferase [Pikeienuella sp. HZG-20]|uniref:sulfotransferase n=1 Tax=Paludibacillus litoralis TaxID=3133267 RepID=UPI0030EEFAFD